LNSPGKASTLGLKSGIIPTFPLEKGGKGGELEKGNLIHLVQ
jgi:hypothetical protein